MLHLRTYAMLLALIAVSCLLADGWEPIQPTGDIPAPVYGHSMVKVNGDIYLFGGIGADRGAFLNTLYKYLPESKRWSKETPANNPPAGRAGHSSLVYNNKMYVFCGEGQNGNLNEVWAYDLTSKRWEKQTPAGEQPTARSYQGAVLVGDQSYVLGGKNGTEIYGDMWSYNLQTNAWVRENPIAQGPRYGHSMSYINGKIYVYGGETANGLMADTWYYDFTYKVWNRVMTSKVPPGRKQPVNDYDDSNMWVCGGFGGSGTPAELNDIWEYNVANNTWTQKASGPINHQSAGVVIPATRAEDIHLFLFGGLKNNQPVAETWQYNSDDDPPQPVAKEIKAQIGALGKCRFVLYYLDFDKDQAKVKIDFTWAEEKAKFHLFALRVPCHMRTPHPALTQIQDDAENFDLGQLKHFEKIAVSPVEVAGRQTISKTLAVKQGTLILLLWHYFWTPAAKDITFKASEMTDLPTKAAYLFPIGMMNKAEQTHFVQFPVAPVRWHSKYPPGTDGKETTETGTNLWKWQFVDKTKRLCPSVAYVKFDLP